MYLQPDVVTCKPLIFQTYYLIYRIHTGIRHWAEINRN